MSDLKVIAQIINNVPLLWAEKTTEILTEVNTFVRCCENILTCLTEENEKRQFLTLLPTKFRGRAAKLFDGVECDSFENFKTMLYNNLVNTKPYVILVNEIRTCKQLPFGSFEPVKTFGERIKSLLKLCKQKLKEKHLVNTEVIEKDLEETAVFAFKAGLINSTYRLIIWQDSENSIEKLIKKIEQIEDSENQILSSNYPSVSTHPIISNPLTQITGFTNEHRIPSQQNINQSMIANNNLPKNLPTNHNTLNNFQQPIQENNNYQQLNYSSNSNIPNRTNLNFKCGFCGKSNHNYKKCRIRKSTPFCTGCKMYGHNVQVCPIAQNSRSINNIRRVNDNKKNIRCDFCQRRGHVVENCFAKRNWENKFKQTPQEGNSRWAVTQPPTMN